MKKGSRVRLKKDSRFYNQNYGIGTIVRSVTNDGWTEVRWDDPYACAKREYRKGVWKAGYPIYDLQLANIKNTRLVRKLFPNAKIKGDYLEI